VKGKGDLPRIRSISPRAPKDEDLAALTFQARLLYHYLPLIADCAGRLQDRPKLIKAELLPYDDVDMDGLLEELARDRCVSDGPFIRRYGVDGKLFIEILRFDRYQHPHPNERCTYEKTEKAGTAIPRPINALAEDDTKTVSVPSQDDTARAGSLVNWLTGSLDSKGNSDSADAEVGSQNRPDAGDVVWFLPNGSIGWNENAAKELEKRFPTRTGQLARAGENWLTELRGLSNWHQTAPRSKRKRVSAQRWLLGRLFPRAERGAIHAEQHRPRTRASPNSAPARKQRTDEALQQVMRETLEEEKA